MIDSHNFPDLSTAPSPANLDRNVELGADLITPNPALNNLPVVGGSQEIVDLEESASRISENAITRGKGSVPATKCHAKLEIYIQCEF